MKIASVLAGLLLVFASAAAASASAADPNDVCSRLLKHLNQTRSGEVISVIVSVEELKRADPQRVLSLLAEYEKDAHLGVRHSVYYYEYAIATAHPQPEVRHEVGERLVRAVVDPNDRRMRAKATKFVLSFTSEDFSDAAKGMLRSALLRKNVHFSEVLVCGVADMKEQLGQLQALVIDELAYAEEAKRTGNKEWYYTTGWAARLARARMGVTEDIERCIKLVDDEIEQGGYFEGRVGTPVTQLLRDIAYIRQAPAIEYLQRQLGSSRKLWGAHGDPSEPVASYVLDLLADCLKDFPIEKRPGRWYSPEEIEQVQNWMGQQKPWNIIR
jgi:hypothetical protein